MYKRIKYHTSEAGTVPVRLPASFPILAKSDVESSPKVQAALLGFLLLISPMLFLFAVLALQDFLSHLHPIFVVLYFLIVVIGFFSYIISRFTKLVPEILFSPNSIKVKLSFFGRVRSDIEYRASEFTLMVDTVFGPSPGNPMPSRNLLTWLKHNNDHKKNISIDFNYQSEMLEPLDRQTIATLKDFANQLGVKFQSLINSDQ